MIRRDAIDRRARQRIERSGWTITREPDARSRRWVAKKEITEKNDEGELETRQLFESDYTLEGLSAVVLRREREERDFGGRVLAS
jgi:hypothetical protein